MTPTVFLLNFLTFILPLNNHDSSFQAASSPLPDDEAKKAFTESFMKFFNGSFYTNDFMEAFAEFRDGKQIIHKDYPELVQYKNKLTLPGKTAANINYILNDKKANVPFHSKHKELSAARLDFEQNAAWVREALGPSYVAREVNRESDNSDYSAHFFYFYAPGVDTSSQYAFQVGVNYIYSKSRKGQSTIVIYSHKRE